MLEALGHVAVSLSPIFIVGVVGLSFRRWRLR